jgi:hypothetical protein
MNDHEVLLSSLRRLAASYRSVVDSEVLLFKAQQAISQTRQVIRRSDMLIESLRGSRATQANSHRDREPVAPRYGCSGPSTDFRAASRFQRSKTSGSQA